MARSDDDYYAILGVSRYATDEDIKKAFRKLARDTHPDKNPNDPSAKERFQNLQRAYDTLKDQLERSKYDEDNPTHGHGAGTARQWGASARATRSTTAQRYAASTTHAPSWTTSSAAGFGDGYAQQASRSRTKADYDPYAEFTSARKTKSGHTYETGGTFRGSGKSATAEYEDIYTSAYPPKRESAYARTSQRQYTTTPRHSGAASPRPKSTTGTQGYSAGSSRHAASNDPSDAAFNLSAYIREKRAKELAKEEEDQRIEEARRRAEEEKRAEARKREDEERRARHRRSATEKVAAEKQAAATEAARRHQAEEPSSSYRHAYTNGYTSRKAAYASYSQSEEDDLMKEADEKLKESGTHSHHRKTRHTPTTSRKKSPVKQSTNFGMAEPTSPKPPTKSEWWGAKGQSADFTFRAHVPSHTDSEDVHVFEATPTTDSEKSEPEHGDYFDAFDSKENTSQKYGAYVGRNRPKHTSTFGAQKEHENPKSPLGRRGSVPHRSTAPSSPTQDQKRDIPASTKAETSKAEFVFGDGVNPFVFQEASSPQQERPKHYFSTAETPRPTSFMPTSGPNVHHMGEDTSSSSTFAQPKSQPSNGSQFLDSSMASSDSSATPQKDAKASLFENLRDLGNITWLPSHSDTSSSPRKKRSVPSFKNKKKATRGRPASTDGKYRTQPTFDTESEGENGRAPRTKAAPQPAEDVEPMDTEPDMGIPEPTAEPKLEQPRVNNPHAQSTPRRPATVQPSSTLGVGLEGMGTLGAVPPLSRSPADVGLGGFDEMKQTLPFSSQAETKPPKKPARVPSPKRQNPIPQVPRPPFWNLDSTASVPAEPPFEVPQPPKVPKRPEGVSLSSYNRFYETLGPYILDWNKYEATVQAIRGELTGKGMEAPAPTLDAEGIKKYIARVQEKDVVLDDSFRKARQRHIDALTSWVEFRDQVVGMNRG